MTFDTHETNELDELFNLAATGLAKLGIRESEEETMGNKMTLAKDLSIVEAVPLEQVESTAKNRTGLRKKLELIINFHSQENESDTPDFILADYLIDCLNAFDKATKRRTEWYKE